MTIKHIPDDFLVEELIDFEASQGPFALYRLEKTGWTTPDSLAVIRRRWQLNPRRLSYGGLKDRHARTIQHFSIFRGPQRNMNHQGFAVVYLGQVEQPFTSDQINANRFQIVVRGLTATDVTIALEALEEVRSVGVPNYFDDQRFGSTSAGSTSSEHQFIAKEILLGRYEEALRLALAAPYEFDRRPQKQEKALLRAHWGDWPKLKAVLPKGHARSLITYLVDHPTDCRGAIERLRPELRSLYLSAYQSHLWNRQLALWLRANIPASQLVDVSLKL